ncbi:MAG: glycosyltransferase [Desulfomonilaceae bacterium]|nr:glycosyltransferase [Desulfomonilaceae bacterium]
MPHVSVIIPTYNRAHVLGRAIRSVLTQTYRDFELIVVDDGSTDDTAGLQALRDGRVTLVRQANRGVSAARNAGIRRSRGALLAFLDSDDEWLPDKLARQVDRAGSNEPYFVCHTDEIWVRDGKIVPQKRIHRKQGGRFFERSLQRCLISPSSVMLSRFLLDRVGRFDEDLPAAEDYDLWLRITAFWDVDFINEPLVVKHGGRDDQLSRVTPVIDRYRIRAIRKVLDIPELPENCRECAIRELIRKARIVAAGCRKRNKEEEAEIYLELARSYEAARAQTP